MTEEKKLQDRLSRLSVKGILGINRDKPTLEPVNVILHDKSKNYMERIIGTTKYLAHNKKIIYDTLFLKLYNFDKRIPEGCFAVGGWLLKIEQWAHIDRPARFLEVLDSPPPKCVGTRFYLDDILYMDNVPFRDADGIRNNLLLQRSDGIIWFEVLKIVDPSGNETLFLPSKKAQKAHADNTLLSIMDKVSKHEFHEAIKK